MEVYIKDSKSEITIIIQEYVIEKMVTFILVNGWIINIVEKEFICLLMERNIRESLKTAKGMDLDNIIILMVIFMRVCGVIIIRMVKDLCIILLSKRNMKECLLIIKKKGMEFWYSNKGRNIEASLWKIYFMVEEFFYMIKMNLLRVNLLMDD